MKNIELEFRAEVKKTEVTNLKNKIKRFRKKSLSRRLSVMYLGKISNKKYDIRIRIDSFGKSEIVLKKGHFHTHDREEHSVKIRKDQIIPLIKLFSTFGFNSKVTERENELYNLPGGIKLVWVKAGHISYIELEKMTDEVNKNKDNKKLQLIMDSLNVRKIDKSQFYDLCDRLTKKVDFVLGSSKESNIKLSKLVKKYIKRN